MPRPGKLEIGRGLQLPLQWITMSSVVYGTRGSGKSTFGRKIAEEVAGYGQRFCAIDPTGAWWGLKSSESGTDEGLPVVIFGGDHADVPLEPGAGAELAEIVAEIDQSVILDLELLSKGRQIVFIGAFLERLYHINRDPLLLLMDEAQRYAPQKPMSPDATKTLGATEDIVKLGRKHGLGSVVFTQRGSGLNKEVSELGDILIAFRTPGVLDQKRIKEWLDANATEEQAKVVLSSISGLPTGTAIFASNHPDLRLFATVAIDRPRTFDSSSTPQVGQKRKEPRVLSKPDLEALGVRMAAAIERADAEDPKKLRAKIAQLEAELRSRPAETVERIVERPVQFPVPYLDPLLRKGIEDVVRTVGAELRRLSQDVSEVDSMMASWSRQNPPPVAGREPVTQREPEVVTPPPVTRVPFTTLPDEPVASINGGESFKIGKAERQILGVLEQHPDGLSRTALAFQTGYSPRTSTLSVSLGRLRAGGAVEKNGDPIKATPMGLQLARQLPGYEPLPKAGRALAEHWLNKLGKAERSILAAMIEAHPQQLDRTQVAEKTGYSTQTSTLSVALGRLRSLKLINGWEVNAELIG